MFLWAKVIDDILLYLCPGDVVLGTTLNLRTGSLPVISYYQEVAPFLLKHQPSKCLWEVEEAGVFSGVFG